jgi:glyoxylase-like metal-dependent hydrolase (beta-lactamase superfamily II)
VHRRFLGADGQLEIELGGYLVRSRERVMLVDAGVGPDGAVGGELLDSLRVHGVEPADVTDVVFTHLHYDHIGWATVSDAAVFTNATYRCHRLDWEHFVGTDDAATRKLTPASDRVELFAGDVTIAPGVDVRLAAGHTPGSVLVVLSSGPARALLIGDVAHCPVELVDDEWAGMGDVDPKLALATRTALARELEGTDVPVAAAHFPGLAFGRLLLGEGRRQWVVG